MFFAVIFFGDPRQSHSLPDVCAFIGLELLFGVPALCIAWDTFHCRIVADNRGLTFYDSFKTRFVPWEAIEDYELRVPARVKPAKAGAAFIRMEGQWRQLPASNKGYRELLTFIVEHARWSKSREWKQGVLPDDGIWPKTYAIKDISGWRIFGIFCAWEAPLIVLFLCTGAAILVIYLLIFTVSIVCGLYFQVKARRPFLNQKIVASPEGILYLKGSEELFVTWDEIESYYLEVLPGNFQPYLYVIEAKDRKIEFASVLDRGLQTLVRDYATQATTKSWGFLHGADDAVIGGAASFWMGGKIGVGPKIHSYHNRNARVLLIISVLMAACMGLMFVVVLAGIGREVSPSDALTFLTMMILLSVGAFFGLRAYLFTALQCEEHGLRKTSFRGEEFLAWNEIEKFEERLWGLFISGGNRKIGFSKFINDPHSLTLEIEKRSGQQLQRRLAPPNSKD